MADWGVLQGLGAGLQTFGGVVSSNAKTKLEEKLLAEREARGESRLEAREQRAAERLDTTPDASETRYVKSPEGVLMEQIRSKTGKVLEEKMAPQNIIDQYTREEKKESLGLEKTLLDMKKTQAEIDFLPEKYSLEGDYRRALTGAARAREHASYNPQPRAGAQAKPTDPSSTSIEAYFNTTDEEGEATLDKGLYKDFQKSPERKAIADGDEAVAAFMENREAEEGMRREGTPEYVISGVREAQMGGKTLEEGELVQRTIQELPEDQQAKARVGLENLRRAEKLIAEGKITPEEARQRLIDNGFPRLAQQIR